MKKLRKFSIDNATKICSFTIPTKDIKKIMYGMSIFLVEGRLYISSHKLRLSEMDGAHIGLITYDISDKYLSDYVVTDKYMSTKFIDIDIDGLNKIFERIKIINKPKKGIYKNITTEFYIFDKYIQLKTDSGYFIIKNVKLDDHAEIDDTQLFNSVKTYSYSYDNLSIDELKEAVDFTKLFTEVITFEYDEESKEIYIGNEYDEKHDNSHTNKGFVKSLGKPIYNPESSKKTILSEDFSNVYLTNIINTIFNTKTVKLSINQDSPLFMEYQFGIDSGCKLCLAPRVEDDSDSNWKDE